MFAIHVKKLSAKRNTGSAAGTGSTGILSAAGSDTVNDSMFYGLIYAKVCVGFAIYFLESKKVSWKVVIVIHSWQSTLYSVICESLKEIQSSISRHPTGICTLFK